MQVELFPSPHDVPELFRTYVDDRMKRWVIEFKYINEEPAAPWQANGEMRFWLGRNSRRIYRIEVAPEFLDSKDPSARARFLEQFTTALTKLESYPQTELAKANYELIRTGLLDQQDTILGRPKV
ncbi:MAG: hypothetical protein WBX02_10625 [Terriglobales bacterium]